MKYPLQSLVLYIRKAIQCGVATILIQSRGDEGLDDLLACLVCDALPYSANVP